MEVGAERTNATHVVRLENAKQVVDAIGGIDDHRLPRLPVTHQVDEIHHLAGHVVIGGKITTSQKLAEIEPVRSDFSGGIGHPSTVGFPPDRGRTAEAAATRRQRDRGLALR